MGSRILPSTPVAEDQSAINGSFIVNPSSSLDGQVNIRIDGYTLEEIPTFSSQVLKQYVLLKNGQQVGDTIIVPKDLDLAHALEEEVTARIAADNEIRDLSIGKEDATQYEVRTTGVFTTFTFEDNKEVSYPADLELYNDVTLTIPADIKQGFISLLTIPYMIINSNIIVNNKSNFPLRIVNGSEYITENTYSMATSGKKIIFARCDGISIEILVIEEVSVK